MDTPDRWLMEMLQNTGLLSDSTLDALQRHLLQPHAPIQIFKRRALLLAHRGANAMLPLVHSAISPVLSATSADGSPTPAALLTSVGVLLVALFVLDTARRLVAWGARVAARAVFWALVAGLAAVVYQRGPAESARDTVVIAGRVAASVAAWARVWWAEYNRLEEERKLGESAQGQTGL